MPRFAVWPASAKACSGRADAADRHVELGRERGIIRLSDRPEHRPQQPGARIAELVERHPHHVRPLPGCLVIRIRMAHIGDRGVHDGR
jgi:hypothetical protein